MLVSNLQLTVSGSNTSNIPSLRNILFKMVCSSLPNENGFCEVVSDIEMVILNILPTLVFFFFFFCSNKHFHDNRIQYVNPCFIIIPGYLKSIREHWVPEPVQNNPENEFSTHNNTVVA